MVKPPTGWAKDGMTDFFDQARHNQFATFHNLAPEYQPVKVLDDLFHRALGKLSNPSKILPPFFFYRSHSAFRASCQLVMAGQIPESYMAMRGCLEFAVHGVYFGQHPEDFETWSNRHDSEESKKKVGYKFGYRRLVNAIAQLSQSDRVVLDHLYELSIDLGAHPNPLAVFGSLKKMQEADADHWMTIYLTADLTHIRSALRDLAQFGVAAFGLMGHVFKERFEGRLSQEFLKIKQSILAEIKKV